LSSQGDHIFNLTPWMQRLGFKRPEDPPLLYSVQPVALISDQRFSTPVVSGPRALYGGSVTASLVQYSALRLISKSPGGCIIRKLVVTGSNIAAASEFTIRMDSPTFISQAGCIPIQLGLGPNVTTANVGHTIVGTGPPPGFPLFPSSSGAPARGASPIDDLFIAAGFTVTIQDSAVNNVKTFGMEVIELPALRG